MENFENELRCLINKYSKEGESNTPDFILAQFMIRCLDAFNLTIRARATWYGHIDAPGKGSVPYPEAAEKEQ